MLPFGGFLIEPHEFLVRFGRFCQHVEPVDGIRQQARRGHRAIFQLEARDLLIIKADRSPPLAVVPLRLAMEVAKAADVGTVVGNGEKDEKDESFQ